MSEAKQWLTYFSKKSLYFFIEMVPEIQSAEIRFTLQWISLIYLEKNKSFPNSSTTVTRLVNDCLNSQPVDLQQRIDMKLNGWSKIMAINFIKTFVAYIELFLSLLLYQSIQESILQRSLNVITKRFEFPFSTLIMNM